MSTFRSNRQAWRMLAVGVVLIVAALIVIAFT